MRMWQFWWLFGDSSDRFVSYLSTYLSIYFVLNVFQDTVRHSTSVVESLFVHSTITGQVILLYLNTKLKTVCCQMLHIYLSKVHSQMVIQSQQISMFAVHINKH